MKSLAPFAAATICTAASMITWHAAVATGPAQSAPPIATAQPIALVNGCEVVGTLERRADGLYAALTARNPGAAAVDCDVHFAVSLTPGASPMSRMPPMPSLFPVGRWTPHLAAGEEAHLLRRIEVPGHLTLPATAASKPQPATTVNTVAPLTGNQLPANTSNVLFARGPDIWTLTLAQEPDVLTGRAGLTVFGRETLDGGEIALSQIAR